MLNSTLNVFTYDETVGVASCEGHVFVPTL